MTRQLKVEALRDNNLFGLSQHKFNTFSAIVDGKATEDDLTNKDYWVHFARSFVAGDEIRCLANDSSFVAYLVVLYVNGTDTLIKCTGFHKLENVDKQLDETEGYEVKNGGAAGWYIKVKDTGERLFEKGFKTQALALRELEDYLKALAA